MLNKKDKQVIERVKDSFEQKKTIKITLYEDGILDVLYLLKIIEKLQEENIRLRKYIKEDKIYKDNLFKYAGKKDKMIDILAIQLIGLAVWNDKKDDAIIFKNKEEVKQYFERKVENE